jgi:DNA-binding response OmpR family regulator
VFNHRKSDRRASTSEKKILIVEDDPDTLLGLRLFLGKKGGYIAVGALDASTALTIAQEEKPDVVVLDIGLPGMNGIEVLRTIKSQTYLAHTPVIVLTGREAGLAPYVMAAGAEAFFQKPADPESLLAAIRRALGE